MTPRSVGIGLAVLLGSACARPTQFDRYVSEDRWSDAAREFASDSTLRYNEHTLYGAAVLYGTPGRPIYDASKGRDLFTMLLARFPGTSHRADATAWIRLLDEILNTRREAAQRAHDLDLLIAAHEKETRELRVRIDSIAAPNDSLRALIFRLETERREREEQLRALRLELQRLKEIDLKPRPPVKPIKP